MYVQHDLSNPHLFESARYIQNQLTKIGVDLFRGSNTEDDICGVLTTGGTESIVFAILTYRNKAFREGKTDEPEL